MKKHIILLGAALLLAGCASQKGAEQVGQTMAGGKQVSMPDAKTYGLVDNKAPADLAAPADYGNQSVDKVVNSMDAPSNQTYYFNENSANLSDADLAALKNQANYLITHPAAKVQLLGYADSRGSRENNVLMAYKCLQSVQNDLLQDGVVPTQIEMVSYGKEKPAMDGYGEPVWAKNRKVELVYEDQ